MRIPRSREPIALAVRELAADPGQMDQPGYDVRLRLTRAITLTEAAALRALSPGVVLETDTVVLPSTTCADAALACDTWTVLLEKAERLAQEVAGNALVAAARLDDVLRTEGSHLGAGHDPYFMS